jgi:purine-binding chemotaxis protein CheW
MSEMQVMDFQDSFIEDTQKDKYLLFAIDKESYGLEIRYVNEIIGIQEITEIPDQPQYMMGVINLRGKIIPIMDIRKRFKKSFKEYNDRTCIIVTVIKDIWVGLVVDTVSEVLDIKEDSISLPPRVNEDYKNRFIKGIGKVENEVKIILDCQQLLGQEELEAFKEQSLAE